MLKIGGGGHILKVGEEDTYRQSEKGRRAPRRERLRGHLSVDGHEPHILFEGGADVGHVHLELHLGEGSGLAMISDATCHVNSQP